VWQKQFEKYRSEGFTVVGIALDVEGVAPARKYYEEFGVTFPALVDPNYATRFGVVPLTFFIDEHGVVQELKDWQDRLRTTDELRPVTDMIREQFTPSQQRLNAGELSVLAATVRENPQDLAAVTELASRYLDLQLNTEAVAILIQATQTRDAKVVARAGDVQQQRLLSNAYLQLARAVDDRRQQVQYATFSYYLNPSIGFAKQISRIIAPEKFDDRPDGKFDNQFREETRRRLETERKAWLDSPES
jgi:hypothetical protein